MKQKLNPQNILHFINLKDNIISSINKRNKLRKEISVIVDRGGIWDNNIRLDMLHKKLKEIQRQIQKNDGENNA